MENVTLHFETLPFVLLGQEVQLNRGWDWYEDAILHDNDAGNHWPTARLVADQVACLEIIVQAKLS